MDYRYQASDPAVRYRGLAIVAVLHLFLAWALISGTARKGLEILKKPLEAVVIQEVIIPPPPPPPPPKKVEPPKDAPKIEAPPPPFVPPPDVPAQVSNAPFIASVATPPPAPVVIAPPPPPAPPAPKPAPAVNRASIGVACPSQVVPEMPRKALQDGVSGTVVAKITIRGGSVKDVEIVSGPRVFHAAVRAAIMQYKCQDDGSGDIIATQTLEFKVAE